MKKIIFLIAIFINFYGLCMDKNQAAENNEKQKLIELHKKELLKIVKPGLESLICNQYIKNSVLLNKNLPSVITISNDSKYLAYHMAGILYVIDLQTHNLIKHIETEHAGYVKKIVISDCNKYIVTASIMGELKIWDLEEAKCLKTITIDGAKIEEFSLDKNLRFMVIKYVYNGIPSVSIYKWNLKSEIISSDVFIVNLTSFCLSDCGNVLLLGELTGKIFLADLHNFPTIKYKTIRSPEKSDKNPINTIAMTPDGNFAFAYSKDNIRMFNIANSDQFPFDKEPPATLPRGGFSLTPIEYLYSLFSEKPTIELENNLFLSLRLRSGNEIISMQLNKNFGILQLPTLTQMIPSPIINIPSNVIFDFSDPNQVIIRQFGSTKNVFLSKNYKYLIFGDYTEAGRGFKLIELSNWVIDELDFKNLKMLIELITIQDPVEIIKFYNQIKDNFDENLQKYIERYLRSKLAGIYYAQVTNHSERLIYDTIGQYLGVDSVAKESKDNNSPKCAQCKDKNAPHCCSKCKLAYYCTKECQQKHWAKHKLECQAVEAKQDK